MLELDSSKSDAMRDRTRTTSRRTGMDDQKTARELLGQLSGQAVETATVWADANQRVLRELVDFSAATAKEGVTLYAELQQSALEALRLDSVEKAFKLLEGHAQTFARSAGARRRASRLAPAERAKVCACPSRLDFMDR